ncbi:hypothetical protein [Kocuria rosea]|uniref:Uncharacterized protein n=1 Tax=Kocuria rosea TaxID=1275 RepID=A0A4R5YN33_KOCRO|nr:hypothetical protein [Kocuria rosea]TDL46509.1 hypothetical protein E2R59_00340 [Kocuria rosea]
MGQSSASGWSTRWWDVTIWGTILLTVLIHAVLHGWTDEHTVAAVAMGAWVALNLIWIHRNRSRRQRAAAESTSPTATDQQATTSSTTGVHGRQRAVPRGWIALVFLAAMVVFILRTDNLMAPTTALGVWIAFAWIERLQRRDPLERRPPDPSLHDATRRN